VAARRRLQAQRDVAAQVGQAGAVDPFDRGAALALDAALAAFEQLGEDPALLGADRAVDVGQDGALAAPSRAGRRRRS
jgi:hypothetical protein